MTRPPLRSVLVGSDLSDDSDSGLQTAAAVASAAGAELHVFHCITKPVFPYWEGLLDESTREQWIRNARLDLDWQLQRVLGDSTRATTIEVSIGEAARGVSNRATAIAADLIVVGSHQPRGALDDLLGTTADRVVRTARIPCLIANNPVVPPLRRVLLATDFKDARVKIFPRILSAPMPVDGIRMAAERMEAELIVMGTHGHNMLERALIGSVASAVVRMIRFPVLLVPPQPA